MGTSARVQSYVSPEAACPICIFPPNQYSNIVGLRNPCDAPLEQQTVPSFSTSISLVSSVMAHEAVKMILGLEEFRKNKTWPGENGEPLGPVFFMDLKNNRYTLMALKRNQACFVCGKDGTTKSVVKRIDLPIREIRARNGGLTHAVARVIASQGKAKLFSEDERGEHRIDGKGKYRIRKGDYIKVLVEDNRGDMNESICRLT